jgi:pimeloyl-ACP methyl ester carboxylesterase
VATAGPADGDPIVCLHGWPQHWYLWREVIGPLADAGYRVICPDLRGFGWTDAPRRGYEKEQLASDVLALMDALEINRFKLIGHDWGGWVGYLLCLRAPERIDRYLALNILPPFVRVSPAALIGAWRFWYQWVLASPFFGKRAAASLATLTDARAARIGLGTKVFTPEVRRIFVDQFAEPERARATVQYYRTFQLRELGPVLAGRYKRRAYTTPTLLLFGDGDVAQDPRNLRGVDAAVPSFSYELIEGCSHFIVDERPKLVVERALAFF